MTFKNILPDQHNYQVHNTKIQKKKGTKCCRDLKGLTNERKHVFKSLIFFFKKKQMCRETKQTSRARQCILSAPTVFPLPPYCSSTHGLAYDITLTKADGNFWRVIDATCLASWRQPLK